MSNDKQPTLGHGKICYLEIPVININESAIFYEKVFGWQSRQRGDGDVGFDDGVGEVSGSWVTGRTPHSADQGVQLSIMVDNAEETLKAIAENGGKIISGLDPASPVKTAYFSDPAGNTFGIYQHGGS